MDADRLEELRTEINQLDSQLVKLLNKRAAIAVRLGRVKSSGGQNIYDPERERKVLDRIVSMNDGPLSKGALEEVYATIITACREIQSA